MSRALLPQPSGLATGPDASLAQAMLRFLGWGSTSAFILIDLMLLVMLSRVIQIQLKNCVVIGGIVCCLLELLCYLRCSCMGWTWPMVCGQLLYDSKLCVEWKTM